MSNRDFAAVQSSLTEESDRDDNQRSTLNAVLAAVAANDTASLPQYFTEHVEFDIHGMPGMDGAWRGRKEVVAAIESNFAKVSNQKTLLESLIQQHDSIVLRVRETGLWTASRKPYEFRGVIWFTFEGSLIKHVEEFLTDCQA